MNAVERSHQQIAAAFRAIHVGRRTIHSEDGVCHGGSWQRYTAGFLRT
jgi:hypothetical protein